MNTDISKEHKVYISDRKLAELSSIEYVESFDEGSVVCFSPLGGIAVEGEQLKIDSFSVDTGRLVISGNVSGIYYFSKTKEAKPGIFSRRTK